MVAKVDAEEILAEARYRGVVIVLFATLAILIAAGVTAYSYRYRQVRIYRDLYRSERERRVAQEEFRATLYSIGDAVITTDTGGLVKQMNPVAEALTGWLEGEAKGQPLDEVFHIVNEDTGDKVENPVQRVLREGVTVGLANHTLLVAQDGVETPIADSGAPIRDENGVISGVVLVFRDQTQERAAEEALRGSEERYRTVADFTYDWEYWVDREGKLLYVSPSCERITGYSVLEFLNDPRLIESIVHPDDLDEVMNHFHLARTVDYENSYLLDFRIIDRDGRIRWVNHACQPVYGQSGLELGRRASNRDITDRKNAEDALLESEARFRRLIKLAPLPMCLVTRQGALAYFNDQFVQVFGYTHEDVPTLKEWRQKAYPDENYRQWVVDTWEAALKRAIAEKTDIAPVEYKVACKQGEMRLVEMSGIVIENSVLVTFVDVTERRRAEEALKESEERFRSTFEQAAVGICHVAPGGHFLRVNTKMSEILGYSSEELFQLSFQDVIHSEDIEPHLVSVRRVLTDEIRTYSGEERCIRKDGVVVWVHVTSSLNKYASGNQNYMIFVVEDISARKAAEQAVRESEERFRSAFSTSPDSININRLSDGVYMDINDGFTALTGFTRDEVVGRSSFDIDIWADLKDRERLVAELVKHGRVNNLQAKFRLKDGRVRTGLMSASVTTINGVPHILSITRDIDDLKRAEEDRTRLATAIDQAAEAVVITDTDGTIVYVNPAFERTTGYSRDEALGKNPRILKSGQHDEKFYKHMWETIASGQVWSGHLITRKKDGALFEEEATISPIREDGGEIVNYVAVKRDVTKEVSLQKQLLQAQKMEAIGTLAGGIAHDFNNLLQVTLGYSELLLHEKKEDNPEYADLKKIFSAARNGADLVQRLLTFSRKVEPKLIVLNLNRMITQVDKLLRRTIPKMIEVHLDLDSGVAEIQADPTQMEQILMNLAVNARDAMPDGGSLTIGTRNTTLDEEYCSFHAGAVPGDYVLLTVSDTGHGMDKETVGHIFEPFYTTKELGRGTGLGLAMVYGIVSQHGGHIACYSEEGRGTTFTVYFPAIPAEADVRVEASKEMPTFGTETILLVDDEDMVRELGERILRKSGYTMLVAPNGAKALALYTENRDRISLVILDLIMPGMGGKQCLEELLKIDPQVRVLISSGFSGDVSVKESLDIGALGFVGKPFRMNELLLKVRKLLDKH
ncbi:MAG: PAS domain S-box protein [Desulfomonile tiedjei]|uniref:histidine kinase n=1 Tax=Desulfomonile tiedjei TaxID=2358 RepID=A0A9D6Z4B3_9BACT|nr:PAS domain S-box protein [Desulfomonile tiedjei]